jgi:hypothetical protein
MTASSKKSEEQDQTNDPATNKIVSGTPLLVQGVALAFRV